MYRFYFNTYAREQEANKNVRLKISCFTHELHIKPNVSLLSYGRKRRNVKINHLQQKAAGPVL